MATHVVYFTVGGHKEQAEFKTDDTTEDVREIFRAAAEAGSYDILKLYNNHGNLINISPKLSENTPDTRYNLEVIAAYINGTNIAAELGFDLADIESSEDNEEVLLCKLTQRLRDLEHKILVESGNTPPLVTEMKEKVEAFRQKLEGVDHLSWLGLYKDISSGTSLQPFWDKHTNSSQKTAEHCHRVFEQVKKMSQIQVTAEVREYLKKPTFDNWQWDDPEMVVLLRQMYIDLGLTSQFNIEMRVLEEWLQAIYKHYNNVPFHNFKHCFMVTQMMYGLICLIDLPSKLEPIELLILLTSAICHDLDHPGYNNAYQINARTELALRYNDISPLENHHCSVAFEILESNNCNIFRNLSTEQFKRVREGMIKCILSTDMAKHSEIIKGFRSMIPVFDCSIKEHKDMMMQIVLKVADVSNEVRPMQVAQPWLECLLQEFFNQSDLEKLEGLPVAPFMDRDKVTKPSSQIGFIKFVLLPLFESLGDLFPVVTEDIIVPVRKALDYYTEMQGALEEEKKRKEKEVAIRKEKHARANMKGASPLDKLPGGTHAHGRTNGSVK